MKKLALSIGFSEHVLVSAQGKAGGICLLWSNSRDFEVIDFDSLTIAVTVREEFCSWSLIGFYSLPYKAKRRKAWENLHALIQSLNNPWMCFGDFHVMVEEAEKEGGIRGSTSAPNFLKELLFDFGAVDLGHSGNKFTWWNKRWGKGAIKERLDCAISCINWRVAFPKGTVFHLGAVNSDHSPLLIDTNPIDEFVPRPFRFEVMWTRDPHCGGIIKKAWELEIIGLKCFKLYCKQAIMTSALKKGNRKEFGLCHTKIKELSNKIEDLQKRSMNETNAQMEVWGEIFPHGQRTNSQREMELSVFPQYTSGQSLRVEYDYSQYLREALIMVVGALITPSEIKGLKTPAS